MNIHRALISVSIKTGIIDFARKLHDRGIELISTGGTAVSLAKAGIPVTRVDDVTGFPEILQGRVKTLHPKIFGGILARLGDSNHMKELGDAGISPIDMVVVNLRPFEQLAHSSRKEASLLESIDIGGVALLRAAAKNHRDVVPVCDPRDYDLIIGSLDECGDVTLQDRRMLALKAFFTTMKYDSTVHSVLSELYASEKFEYRIYERVETLRDDKHSNLSVELLRVYDRETVLDNIDILKGNTLSYQLVQDILAAALLSEAIDRGSVALFKNGKLQRLSITEDVFVNIENVLSGYTKTMSQGTLFVKSKLDESCADIITKLNSRNVLAQGFTEGCLNMIRASEIEVAATLLEGSFISERIVETMGIALKQHAIFRNVVEQISAIPDISLSPEEDQTLKAAVLASLYADSPSIAAARNGFVFSLLQGQTDQLTAVKVLCDFLGSDADKTVIALDDLLDVTALDVVSSSGVFGIALPDDLSNIDRALRIARDLDLTVFLIKLKRGA